MTFERAEMELQSLRAYWAERFPDHYGKGHFAVTRPLHEDIVGDQRQALLVLAAAVLFVLLIVCINLSALLVSRGEGRRREFAVRQALGADRSRLIRQLLGETILLAAIGGGSACCSPTGCSRAFSRCTRAPAGVAGDRD